MTSSLLVAQKITRSIFLCLLLFPFLGSARELHVSPDGVDTNPGSLSEPVKTLGKARDLVRTLNLDMNEDILVYIHEGVYELSEPLVFDETDGGKNGHRVIYKAYDGGNVIISGGRRITGWTSEGNNKWSATVGGVAVGDWSFRQLFINSERLHRARFPNWKAPNDKGTDGFMENTYVKCDGLNEIHVPLDIPGSGNLDPEAEILGIHFWSSSRGVIDHTDGKKIFTKTKMGIWPKNSECGGDRFRALHTHDLVYLENSSHFLDTVNEWFLDESNGKLSVILPAGVDPNGSYIVAPRLTRLVEMNGVSSIRFEGLAFGYQNWNYDLTYGYHGHQAAIFGGYGKWTPTPAIAIVNSAEIQFEDCRFAHMGGNGIGFGEGCSSSSVIGCEIFDIAANGILVGWRGDETSPARDWDWGETRAPSGITVNNNHFHHCAATYYGACGITEMFSRNVTIAHNTVAHMNYTGISAGFRWDNQPTSQWNIQIRNNRVFDAMNICHDGGGIYTLGNQGQNSGSVIEDNLVHNVNSMFAWGLEEKLSTRRAFTSNGYMWDNGSSYMNTSGNVGYDCELNIRINGDSALIGMENNTYEEGTIPETLRKEMEGKTGPESAYSYVFDPFYLVPASLSASAAHDGIFSAGQGVNGRTRLRYRKTIISNNSDRVSAGLHDGSVLQLVDLRGRTVTSRLGSKDLSRGVYLTIQRNTALRKN